jgi:hypothetical protein
MVHAEVSINRAATSPSQAAPRVSLLDRLHLFVTYGKRWPETPFRELAVHSGRVKLSVESVGCGQLFHLFH